MFTSNNKHASFGRHVSFILILAMLFTSMLSGCGTETKETEPVTEAATETETVAEVIELSEEASDSAITKLMKSYFKALKKGDVDALGQIMVNAPSQQTIDREIEYINNYKNVKCYTKEGDLANTYVAYVYYDVKFKNIDTLAPSMIREYICTNEDGELYINNGTVDGDVAAWLEEVHNSDAVNALLNDVNAKLTSAASEDEKLQALVGQLGAGTEETAAEETTATESASEGESETAAADDSVTETTAESASETESTAEETTAAEETTEEETTVEETTVEETKKSNTDYEEFKKVKVLYTVDITNVRKSASASSKLLGRLNEGKKVKAIGKKDGWYVIKYGSKKGYIKADLLTSKKPKTEITFKAKDDKVEALQNVRMRKKPSESAKSLGTLPGGTKVTRTGYNKKWTRIVYNGKTVYVATKYVEKVSE